MATLLRELIHGPTLRECVLRRPSRMKCPEDSDGRAYRLEEKCVKASTYYGALSEQEDITIGLGILRGRGCQG